MKDTKKKILLVCLFFIVIAIAFKSVQIYGVMKIKNSMHISKKTNEINTGYNLYEKIPQLNFSDENNNKVNLSNKKGKNIIICFWNSESYDACEQVRAFYVLRETFKKYENTECVLVDVLNTENETKEKALQHLKDNNIEFSTLFDENGHVFNKFNLKNVPATLVINKEGVLIKKHEGIIYDNGLLEGYIEDAVNGSNASTEKFINERLINSKGGINAQYGEKEENILSESEGVMLEYAVLTNNSQLFNSTLNYINNNMKTNELVSWQIQNGEKSKVNALIDDLRIYGAMKDGSQIFEKNKSELRKYRKAIYKYNTNENNLIDFYDFENNQKAQRLTLCYADFNVLKKLAEDDIKFYKIYESSMNIVKNGYINDDFPLYYSWYDYKTNSYQKDELNTSEAMVTLLHLAEAGEIKEQSVKWLKETIKDKGLLGRYTTEGKVAHGYEYESTAAYAITAMIGVEVNDYELVDLSVSRMEKMRIDDTTSKFNGAFGNKDGSGIYSFDQCMPLAAYCQLQKKDIKAK